jgi:MFS family permease
MRNVWILTLAQAFAACGTIMLVTFGGIVGTRIAPSATWATLPLSFAVLGVAATTLPAALLMQRIGRRPAFVTSAVLSAAAALLCAWATAQSAFPVFCLAAALLGAGQAFVLQYRFAATEYVPAEATGRAVSLVMLGTLAAALIGPELGDRARHLGGWPEFTGSFVVLAALLLLSGGVLVRLEPAALRAGHTTAPARPLRTIAAQPAFVVALLASLGAWAVMSFIMTATPISMHVLDGLSVSDTKRVISAHLLAMYLPSLASGWMTRALGLKPMMLLGVALMGLCIAIAAYVGHHFVHYAIGLVLLGVGWNLLFVAGTTLLTHTYTSSERFKAQGLNDFVTFGVQAVVSLLAGVAVQLLGWKYLNLLGVPVLAMLAVAIAWLHLKRRSQTA